MKKIILFIIAGLLIGFVGFTLGNVIGREDGRELAERMNKYRDIKEIRDELAERERRDISIYLDGNASLSRVDEGGFFTTKYVQYFKGSLSNSALLAPAKDIKLNVDFYSKTGSKIGNQEIVIYEYLHPGDTISFKEKINAPNKVENFKFQILEAKSE